HATADDLRRARRGVRAARGRPDARRPGRAVLGAGRATARTASMAAPAARRPARTLPGDSRVSASSRATPPVGEASSRRAT
ncbi:hypothetical protein KC217_21135, partial [Mycobacterium tuberculosis]|nr:hypothetical protein [Mycobacterium tuberculosis]